jgi:CheY-like chemotaxis protein
MIAEETVGILRETIDRRIFIDVEFPENPWMIMADPSQFHQVIMNLVINARDAITERLESRFSTLLEQETASYRILIQVENRTIHKGDTLSSPDSQPGNYIVLRVKDNGPGIKHHVLSRIFEPFFTTKNLGQGTGLGLATVFGIVKQHNGWIEVQSEVGKGSIFDVYIPIHLPPAEQTEEKPTFVDAPGGNETILLVDDEKMVRDLGRAILKRKGYSVITANDGKRGLESFLKEKENVDLVILDQTMPYLSGKEVLGQIRLISPFTKVLMSSGYVDTDLENEFRKMGAAGFVAKPYSIEGLASKVRKILDAPDFQD